MSHPIQSLHQFVVSLLTDNASHTAFLADPTSALATAGLSDVTGADVQDATALVTDHLPAPAADMIEARLAALPASPVDDLHCAIRHLHCLCETAHTLPAADFGALTTATATSPDGFAGSLAYAGDHVDAALAAAAGGDSGSVAGALTSDLGAFAGSAAGTADSLAAATALTTPHGAVAGTFATGGGFAAAGTITAPDSTFAGAVSATGNAVAGTLESVSPLGTYGVSTAALPSVDPASTVDAAALGDTTAATGAIAAYTATGGEALAGAIAGNSATVAGYFTTVGGGAGQAVATGGSELAGHVTDGSAMVSEAVAHVPALPAPHLPATLPTDLPMHAVADLPHLPVPDAGHELIATAHTAVTDTVSHSPLADLGTVDHAAALPDLADTLHTDLPLGH